jgi:hypothetical protein
MPGLNTNHTGWWDRNQSCQVVYFHTKSRNFGMFWEALELNILVFFTAIRYIFLEICCMAISYILWSFGVVFPILVYFTKENLANLTETLFLNRDVVPLGFSWPWVRRLRCATNNRETLRSISPCKLEIRSDFKLFVFNYFSTFIELKHN